MFVTSFLCKIGQDFQHLANNVIIWRDKVWHNLFIQDNTIYNTGQFVERIWESSPKGLHTQPIKLCLATEIFSRAWQ
jgi:hypothetical protein